MESICRRLKTRFKYVVLITHDIELSRVDFGEADLFVSPSEDMDASELKRAAAESIQKMWSEKSPQ